MVHGHELENTLTLKNLDGWELGLNEYKILLKKTHTPNNCAEGLTSNSRTTSCSVRDLRKLRFCRSVFLFVK